MFAICDFEWVSGNLRQKCSFRIQWDSGSFADGPQHVSNLCDIRRTLNALQLLCTHRCFELVHCSELLLSAHLHTQCTEQRAGAVYELYTIVFTVAILITTCIIIARSDLKADKLQRIVFLQWKQSENDKRHRDYVMQRTNKSQSKGTNSLHKSQHSEEQVDFEKTSHF